MKGFLCALKFDPKSSVVHFIEDALFRPFRFISEQDVPWVYWLPDLDPTIKILGLEYCNS